MSMEVEMHIRITLHHLPEVLNDLQGIHHPQGVRQHETFDDLCRHKAIHQLINVFGRILHAIRPVLQIEVDADALAGSIFQFLLDVADMFLRCFLQLKRAMLQRALGQKIHHPTPTRGYPVDALATIYKAQNLHTFYECVFLSVGTNLGYSITLTL